MKKKLTVMVMCIIMAMALSGCSFIDTIIGEIKGELVGNDYNISQYDNFGNKVLSVSGDKINLSAEVDSDGEPTSYVDITIDGYDWKHVGSTLVFAQNGVDMITDFQIPESIETNGEIGRAHV